MELEIHTIDRNSRPTSPLPNRIYLKTDYWNDYSFMTMFQVYVSDEKSQIHDLGSVKIGFSGQTTAEPTYASIDWPVNSLPDNYFSLGMDVDYYRKIGQDLNTTLRDEFCRAMRDIVFDKSLISAFSDEDVFKTSLMRTNSISAIHGQYARVLHGQAALTDFNFKYKVEQTDSFGGYQIDFNVKAGSTPRTNVHAIIGRNGVGKTTFLNDLIVSALGVGVSKGEILTKTSFTEVKIPSDYFSSIISVSFSAFDPFCPPEDRPEPDEGPAYHYIGIKDAQDSSGASLKSTSDLHNEFVSAMNLVLSQEHSAQRWRRAIGTLETDENFRDMQLTRLVDKSVKMSDTEIRRLVKKMSSGHAIVILTITKLVAYVQEKTLVLIDEPESHLHPPLLSALARSVSDLLYNRNGVALIATHSPVVLQEVPKSCVWKVVRSKNRVSVSRPEIETFAENVGILTREVFGLEVDKSGFHQLLSEEVQKGKSFEEIWAAYDGQIGFEGQALLRTLLADYLRKAG